MGQSSQPQDLDDLRYWILRLEPTCIDDVFYAVRVYTSEDDTVDAAVDRVQRQVIELGYESEPRLAGETYRYMLYTYVSPQLTFENRLEYMEASEICSLRSKYDYLQTEAIVYYLQSQYHSMTGGSALLPEQVMDLLKTFYTFCDSASTGTADDCYAINLFTNWRSHGLADPMLLAANFARPGLTEALQGLADEYSSLVG